MLAFSRTVLLIASRVGWPIKRPDTQCDEKEGGRDDFFRLFGLHCESHQHLRGLGLTIY